MDGSLKYDWFDVNDAAVYIIYLNTSFFQDYSKQAKNKFIDHLCAKIREGHEKGLGGHLIKSKHTGVKITRKEFINSFKILSCHHSFHSQNPESDFLDEHSRKRLLSNLSLLDIQIQISGHGHQNCRFGNQISDHFDDRARYRYLYNYLKLNYSSNRIVLDESDKIKKHGFISRRIKILINILTSAHGDKPNEIIKILERIATGEIKDAHAKILELIKEGGQRLQDKDAYNKAMDYVNELSKEDRKTLKMNSQAIVSKILKLFKHRTFEFFNSGSAGLTNSNNIESSFNIYEIENTEGTFTFYARQYVWDPNNLTFYQKQRQIINYDDLRIQMK